MNEILKRWRDGFVPWAADTAERMARSAAASFASTMTVGDIIGVDAVHALSILQRGLLAAGGAAATVVIAALAKFGGSPASASFRNPPDDPPPAGGIILGD